MYRVTITEITSEKRPTREYEKLADTGNDRDGGAVYGYVETEWWLRTEREVLKQEVEALDVAAVIRAVNNL